MISTTNGKVDGNKQIERKRLAKKRARADRQVRYLGLSIVSEGKWCNPDLVVPIIPEPFPGKIERVPIAGIRINDVPPLPNQLLYAHWGVKFRAAKRWKQRAKDACTSLGMKKLTGRPTIFLCRHTKVEPDYDNLVTSFKHVLDGVVLSGIIEDDGPDYIETVYIWTRSAEKYVTVWFFL